MAPCRSILMLRYSGIDWFIRVHSSNGRTMKNSPVWKNGGNAPSRSCCSKKTGISQEEANSRGVAFFAVSRGRVNAVPLFTRHRMSRVRDSHGACCHQTEGQKNAGRQLSSSRALASHGYFLCETLTRSALRIVVSFVKMGPVDLLLEPLPRPSCLYGFFFTYRHSAKCRIAPQQ